MGNSLDSAGGSVEIFVVSELVNVPSVQGRRLMRFSFALCVCVLIVFFLPSMTMASSIAGKYSDGQLTVELSDTGDSLTGSLTLQNQNFPAVAQTNGANIDGTFTVGADNFPFRATLDGATLSLTSGGKTYSLKRISPPANPLAGYTVVATSDSGKSLVTKKPLATSIQSALEATFPDLARYFGARPTIGSAYEDAHDHRSGGATFGTKLNGQPIRGIVSCKLDDAGGATVAVIYGRSDATKADWDKLATPAAAPAGAPPADTAKALGANAQEYQFPDGTGSITLAEGWKTQAQSAIGPIFIQGPGKQNVWISSNINVLTPDSPALRMMQQNEAFVRRWGGKPAPTPMRMVAEFTDPVQALSDLTPQMSKMSESKGGPAVRIDKIISHKEMPSNLKDGKAAVIVWDVSHTENGESTAYRSQEFMQMAMVGSGSWMMFATGFTSPAETYDHDAPVVLAMVRSEKVNQEVASQRMQQISQQNMAMLKQQADASNASLQRNHDEWMKAQDQRNATYQEQHAAQMAGYAQHNQQWANEEWQKSRNSADFIETIKGTRTVYDTATGAAGTADLNYVNGVVNSLNEAALDPNRFVQIPLRDEMYPAPEQLRR